MSVLVISPHPDDEVLGCGGSICARAFEGHSVQVAYLTSGERASSTEGPELLGPRREREAISALRCLGLTSSAADFMRFGDGQIDEGNETQFISLMNLIRRLRPAVIYVPHEGELSRDHREAFRVTIRAAGMAQSQNYRAGRQEEPWRVPVILAYEIWTPLSDFQYLEPIDLYIDKKVQALSCYMSQSQITKKQSTYIGPGGVALSAYRGAMALGGYAEAFRVVRADSLFTGIRPVSTG